MTPALLSLHMSIFKSPSKNSGLLRTISSSSRLRITSRSLDMVLSGVLYTVPTDADHPPDVRFNQSVSTRLSGGDLMSSSTTSTPSRAWVNVVTGHLFLPCTLYYLRDPKSRNSGFIAKFQLFRTGKQLPKFTFSMSDLKSACQNASTCKCHKDYLEKVKNRPPYCTVTPSSPIMGWV